MSSLWQEIQEHVYFSSIMFFYHNKGIKSLVSLLEPHFFPAVFQRFFHFKLEAYSFCKHQHRYGSLKTSDVWILTRFILRDFRCSLDFSSVSSDLTHHKFGENCLKSKNLPVFEISRGPRRGSCGKVKAYRSFKYELSSEAYGSGCMWSAH